MSDSAPFEEKCDHINYDFVQQRPLETTFQIAKRVEHEIGVIRSKRLLLEDRLSDLERRVKMIENRQILPPY